MSEPIRYHQTCWVIAVDGVAYDIRGDSSFAIRQGKVRKAEWPGATVTIHYGPVVSYTMATDTGLQVVIEAAETLAEPTSLIATVAA